LRVTTRAPGETIISGPIADQAALHGLAKVRGLGLTLVAMPGSARAHPDDPSAGSSDDRSGSARYAAAWRNGMNGDTSQRPSPRRAHTAFGLTLLTVANAALFFVAAVLHLGVRIPFGPVTLRVPEPIPPATVVEAVIGAGFAAAAVALFVHGRRERQLTRAAYVIGLIGTLFGLTVALLRGLRAWTSGFIS
jgi:hypothetical protein